jgi:hypothetical protein
VYFQLFAILESILMSLVLLFTLSSTWLMCWFSILETDPLLLEAEEFWVLQLSAVTLATGLFFFRFFPWYSSVENS